MKSVLALLLCVLPLFASAKEVSGVDLADSLTQDNQAYLLNGAGVRSKFFMDLYVGSLYLPARAQTSEQVLAQQNAIIQLDILSGLITSDKMRDAINEGFDAATKGKQDAAMKANIAAFMALFDAEIKPGDRFVLHTGNDGVIAVKNGVAGPKIGDADFAKALLNIWLGDKPAQKSLKQEMLGQ